MRVAAATAILLGAVIFYELRKLKQDPIVTSVESDFVLCTRNDECHPDIVYGTSEWRARIYGPSDWRARAVMYPARYCVKKDGDCNGAGRCNWIPREILDVRAPTCGCDGKTYPNQSEAAVLGINIAHDGECAGAPYRRPEPTSTGFNTQRAVQLMNDAAQRAADKCARSSGPAGVAHVEVTFDAGGRALSAKVSGPLANTPVAQCVQDQFAQIRMDAFEGEPVTISRSVLVAKKVESETPK